MVIKILIALLQRRCLCICWMCEVFVDTKAVVFKLTLDPFLLLMIDLTELND